MFFILSKKLNKLLEVIYLNNLLNKLMKNNIMLNKFLAYIISRDCFNIYFKEFAINIVTNLISNNTYSLNNVKKLFNSL